MCAWFEKDGFEETIWVKLDKSKTGLKDFSQTFDLDIDGSQPWALIGKIDVLLKRFKDFKRNHLTKDKKKKFLIILIIILNYLEKLL